MHPQSRNKFAKFHVTHYLCALINVTMRVISSAELQGDTQKYLAMASTGPVVVRADNDDTFELVKKNYKKPDADFYRAVSIDQMRKWAHEDIEKMYQLPR